MRIGKWIFDNPDEADETFRQFINNFYQGSKLIQGELKIGK
ncbi:hypothetical protein [Trichormus azollae]